MNEIVCVVITGGPGAGKTEFIAEARDRLLHEYGLPVLVARETATEFFEDGVVIDRVNGISNETFQEKVLCMQLFREQLYQEMMPHGGVLLCDRGGPDGRAYGDPSSFETYINTLGFSVGGLRMRYHGAIHLVTAADGAEEFYTTANNLARSEKPEKARLRDIQTKNSWIGHPHLWIIDNRGGLAEKKKRFFLALYRILGIPESLEIERKFLIERPDMNIMHTYVSVLTGADIEQIYLVDKTRLRREGCEGHAWYSAVRKEKMRPSVQREFETTIASWVYDARAKIERDDTREVIQKRRYYFIWQSQYYMLDIFKKPGRLDGLSILETELLDENDVFSLPPFVTILREVTSDSAFTNAALALKRTHVADQPLCNPYFP